ncbi:unnamed protein product, partial [Allacma fusca]
TQTTTPVPVQSRNGVDLTSHLGMSMGEIR